MGKFVDTEMEKMGGKRVHNLGQGDDDVNIEEDFVRWKEAFWTSVCQEFSLEVARIRSYQTQRPPFDVKNPFLAPVKVNRNLHSEKSDRYCMHVELGLEESRIRYEAGDHVAIYPTNDLQLVNKIGQLLEI